MVLVQQVCTIQWSNLVSQDIAAIEMAVSQSTATRNIFTEYEQIQHAHTYKHMVITDSEDSVFLPLYYKRYGGEQEYWFREGGCHELSEMGKWELVRLLLEWGKSSHPHLRG